AGHAHSDLARRRCRETQKQLDLSSRSCRLAAVELGVDTQCCETRNRFAGELEVRGIALDSDAGIADGFGRSERRCGACEWIEHQPLPERQHTANELAQKRLRLQARMRRDLAFSRPS